MRRELVLLALALGGWLSTSCKEGGGMGGGADAASTGGAGGRSSQGGTGGVTPAGTGGGTGGNATPSGTGGTGGVSDAGTGDLGETLTAPPGAPARDCSADKSDYCVAAAGSVDGKAFELICLPDNQDFVSVSATHLALSCENQDGTLVFRVETPEKGAGSFDFEARAAQAMLSTLEILRVSDDTAKIEMGSKAANLADAHVRVNASADGLRYGVFQGTWNTPATGCRAFAYACGKGSVAGSFSYRRKN